jgi:hypothetical protein
MKEFNMEIPATPAPEKSPAAKIMSAQEMNEFADVLMLMRDGGYGDKTINEIVSGLDQQIMLKMGKKTPEEIAEELQRKEQ